MHYHELARRINGERQREAEIRMRSRLARPRQPRERSIQQAIGRVLIRVGSALDSDDHIEAGRVAPPRQPETQT